VDPYTIHRLSQESPWIEAGIPFFWKQWGNEDNFAFFQDCILHALPHESSLPNFYLLLHDQKMIGSYTLITNDLISRQDLMPWLACLYVDEAYRNQGLAERLLNHGLQEAGKMGYGNLYLSTDLKGFYEKKGWELVSSGYNPSGVCFPIYAHSTLDSAN